MPEPVDTPVPEPVDTPVPEPELEDYGYKDHLIKLYQGRTFMAEDYLKTGGKNQQPPSEAEIRETLQLTPLPEG